jgi:hypothetical protein
LVPRSPIGSEVAVRRGARGVTTDEVREHVQPSPSPKHLLHESLHRLPVGRVRRCHHQAFVAADRRFEGRSFRLIADGEGDMRPLLQIRAYHRWTDVSRPARKYYGALREIEHRR